MNETLLTIVTWIHLLSAIVWIGGIFFILFVALPSAKKILEQPGKFMSVVEKRFVPLANISIIFILLTGIFMSLSSHNFSDIISLENPFSQTLSVKIMAALIMSCIHFYRGLILTPKIERLTAEGSSTEDIKRLHRLSLNLVKTNFVLGITILFLTGMLSVY